MAGTVRKDPYAVLGVSRASTHEEIQAVYRGLARELHPDKTGGDAKAEERLKGITGAYGELSTPEGRRRNGGVAPADLHDSALSDDMMAMADMVGVFRDLVGSQR